MKQEAKGTHIKTYIRRIHFNIKANDEIKL